MYFTVLEELYRTFLSGVKSCRTIPSPLHSCTLCCSCSQPRMCCVASLRKPRSSCIFWPAAQVLCPDRLTPNFDKLIPFSSKSQKWKGFSNQKSKKPTKCHLPCRAVDRQAQLHKTGQLHPPKATSGLSTYDSSEVNKHIKTNKKLEGFLKICSHFKKPPQRGCIPRAHAATSARRSPQAQRAHAE